MVDRIGPVNAVTGAPLYDGRWERQLRGVHQVMGSAARPLGARTGVRPGTSTATVTATSTTWTCQAFAGDADVETAAEAGAYPFSFDAVATGAMTPADGSNSRTDIVYVQIDDPAEDGSGTPAVTRKYLAGVAGSGVAPSPPVARAFVIAQINVPKSGAGSPSVTWVAPYTAAAGGVVPFPKLADLKLWTPPQDGQLAYAMDSGNLWIYEAGATTPGWYHSSGKPDIVTGVYSGGTFSSVVYSAGPTAPYAVNQGGRTYLEGSIVSGSATFTAGVVYTVGSISGPVAPSTTTVRFTTSNISAVAEVTITSAGVITIRLNVTFTGALNLTFTPAVSWITKGLM